MNPNRSRLLPLNRFLLAAAFALATFGSAQTLAAGWSNPATLGTSSLYSMYANNVSVAVGATGNGVAVWQEPASGTLKYAIQQGGVWNTAKTFYTASATTTSNEFLSDPRVVLDSAGTATALWASNKRTLQYCVSGGRVVRCYVWTSLVKAASLAAGATAWTKANVSAQGVQVSDAQIGLDQNGNAVALWAYVEKTGAPKSLQSAAKPAAGMWSPPETLYSSVNPISLPSLAVAATGAAVAVWQEKTTDVSNPYAIRAAYLPVAGSTWSGVEEVFRPAAQLGALQAAIDGNGQAAAAWNNSYAVQWARRSNSAWVSEALVSTPGRVYSSTGPYAVYAGPDLSADALGNFLVGWLENDVAGGGLSVQAQLHRADGGVDSATWTVGGSSNSPRVTTSPDGSLATVAWIDDGDANAYAVSFTPGQGWGQPLLLSAGATQYTAAWGTGVALAGGPNASASAVWLRVYNTNAGIKILASSYWP